MRTTRTCSSTRADRIRSNTPRLYNGAPIVVAAPTTFNLGEFTPPIVTYSVATGNFTITFTDTDEWVDEDDSYMFVYASRPQDPSINYFRGPYQYLGGIEGDAGTPPTSPQTMADVFPLALGQRGFIRVNVSRADGRLSLSVRSFCTAAA